ncbi:nucleotide sugar dehydrogenase [Pseudovirgaria hyperparasitica]|uniref:UDP-glucose 6-dehydrogenase n=1 Tax=Pseudovirgaria hyperparasitica TaxID=470096 RepID=A0A6A6VUW5_9PEZI|nr:nucleotide sugar dehydrogenase [Pseudovirgaria hyperparasitica]KAF2753410.1 nucleotide sugar dehydrogenase [Pseudovirgaria hyperparasitica]
MNMVQFSSSASDESTFDLSMRSTPPERSLLSGTAQSDATIETRFTSLSDLISLEESSSPQDRQRILPDILNPASAAGIPVRNVCFVGAGYVGVPTAAVIALKNPSLRVTVIDRDERRIRRWNSTHLPLSEPGLNELVRITRDGCKFSWSHKEKPKAVTASFEQDVEEQAIRTPNLNFSTETAKWIATADMIFICVNTGTKTSGVGAGSATDMTAFEGVVREIAANSKTGAILVEKSTVPCRTAKFVQDILENLRPRARMQVLSNPEFLAEGTAVANLLHPDRVIIGSAHTVEGHRAAAALAKLYTSFVDPSRILGTHVWSSELAKLAANAMLAQRISSINSISAICEQTGADVHEVAKAMGMDPRIGSQFLKAGLGFGGSCFRKDIGSLVYLARSLHLDDIADYWESVTKINMLQRTRFSKMVVQRLNGTLVGKKITLLGFAFKKNTDDTRESLAVDIISKLLEERPAEIAVFDPICLPENIQREINTLGPQYNNTDKVKIYTDPYQASMSASAILIITDWDFFKNSPSKRPASCSSSPTTKPVDQLGLNLSPEQFFPQPSCPDDCPDCKISYQGYGVGSDDRIEWARISYHMKRPRLLFDGRDVVDPAEMGALGVRVIGLGRTETGYGGGMNMGMSTGFGY